MRVYGGLAQLIRALCLHRSGLQFESAIPHHLHIDGTPSIIGVGVGSRNLRP